MCQNTSFIWKDSLAHLVNTELKTFLEYKLVLMLDLMLDDRVVDCAFTIWFGFEVDMI